MLFKDLKVIMPIQEALKAEEYDKPTPIQEKAIPSILAGRDLLGCAQTGTGKTAAFAIPILQILSLREEKNVSENHNIRALVLAPTRELAMQIGERFKAYGQNLDLKTTVVFGGIAQRSQIEELEAGVDILVATPGRLLDLLTQGYVEINKVEMFVLDEADRMLDLGMFREVRKIITKLPIKRQNILFSATMPNEVSQLVNIILANPVKIEVKKESITGSNIKQSAYFVEENDRMALLIHLLKDKSIKSVLIFTRTKQRADKVTRALEKEGIKAEAIHGDKSQAVRQATLNSFKNKELRVLVATDVAARGIDVEDLPYVINYDLPNIPETYVHRIGRTGRAGMRGTAISLCNPQEKPYLKAIEELIAKAIPIIKNHPYALLDVKWQPYKTSEKKPYRPSNGKPKSKFDSRRDGKKSNSKQAPKKGKGKR